LDRFRHRGRFAGSNLPMMTHFTSFIRVTCSPVILVCTLALPLAAADSKRVPKDHAQTAVGGTAESRKLDLNTASEASLAAVPVIGQDGARAIIAARPFVSIDGLDRLQGLNAERLEQIRSRVAVSPATIPPEEAMKVLRGGVRKEMPRVTHTGTRPGVDVNSASLETLAALPNVGPELAKKIVSARPIKSLDQLEQIEGIDPEKLNEMGLVLVIKGAPSESKKKSATPDQ
jgi:DNA uptake protein ComE-like DNA-binding protein